MIYALAAETGAWSGDVAHAAIIIILVILLLLHLVPFVHR